ncbi:pyridoxamine 5'-phosphate oxidase [Sphingomonas swuensis]|uniref:Pyridoxine/pyridoxamine 5'-phosphate oxidase n=1 Tax=Sphingomonas swuensis TaxID=977800 RepID=A0ABP7SF26_9SPHN
MPTDPFALFAEWMALARESEVNDPDAMALATATPDGRPSVRIVLMRRYGPEGFGFFTNLESDKGRQIAANPFGALAIHWKSLRKQVRAEGRLEQVAAADADDYFASRSRDSRIGAWASDQSRPLDSRETFIDRIEAVRTRFEGGDVPRPPHWSGFRLVPDRIEFWEDGEFRLHHRRLFTRSGEGWSEGLLYP